MAGTRQRPVRAPTLEPGRETKRGLQRLGGLLVIGIGLVLIADTTHCFLVDREYWPTAKAMAVIWLVCLIPVQFGWRLLTNHVALVAVRVLEGLVANRLLFGNIDAQIDKLEQVGADQSQAVKAFKRRYYLLDRRNQE